MSDDGYLVILVLLLIVVLGIVYYSATEEDSVKSPMQIEQPSNTCGGVG